MGKGGYWGDMWEAASKLTGSQSASPHDMRVIYEEAAKAGALEPGQTKSFAVPPQYKAGQLLGRPLAGPQSVEYVVRNHANSPSGLGYMVQSRMPAGATTDEMVAEALRMHDASVQDMNTYAYLTTPQALIAARAYGDKFGEALQASLLSADRPKLLQNHPITQSLSRDRITRNLDEPLAVFRTPGLGFTNAGPDGNKRVTLGFMHPGGNYMAVPRAMGGSMVGPHETAHALYHRGGIVNKDQKLLDSSPQLTGPREEYMSRWPETQAEAAVLKRMHFLKTGKIIKNQADAQDFMNLLLSEPPKINDPLPNAAFGSDAVKGKPIKDYNMQMRVWSDMMKKASPKDRDKFIELLPKVIRNDKPSTVANA